MRRLLILLPLAALAGCSSIYFQPTGVEYARPEEFRLKYEAVRFPSRDAVRLTGLFLYASTSPVQGTVIQFHGNGENMTSHFLYSAWLTAKGYNVFAFDYRGYGASEGTPTQEGCVEDGMAAVDYVLGRKDVDPGRVAVWGQSLGGAIAAAALALRQGPAVRALILESTFDSYRGMAAAALSRHWMTWAFQWPLSRLLISDSRKPAKYFPRLSIVPVLVAHSADDEVVPYRFGERVFSQLTGPKEFLRAEKARHLEMFGKYGGLYQPRLLEFLDRSMASAKPSF